MLLPNENTIIAKHRVQITTDHDPLRFANWSIKPLTSIQSYSTAHPNIQFDGIIIGYEQMEVIENALHPAVFFPETCTAISFFCGPGLPYAYVVGPINRPLTFVKAKAGLYFVVILSPAQLFSVIFTPLNEINNAWILAEQLVPLDWERLATAMANARSITDRISIWESCHCAIFKQHDKAVPTWIKQAVHYLSEYTYLSDSSDKYAIRRLAENTGYSVRHIRDAFYRYVGMTPKTYIRTIRYKRALHRLTANPSEDIVSLSNELGFFDQSHFINEFKLFTGTTPTRFIREYIRLNQ